MNVRFLLCTLATALTPALPAWGQSANPLMAPVPPPRLGVDGGVNINQQAGTNACDCGLQFTSGSGVAFQVGGVVEWHLTHQLALLGRVAMDQRYVTTQQSSTGPQAMLEPNNSIDTQVVTLNETAATRLTYLTLAPMLRFDILRNLYLAAGPALAIAIGSNVHVEQVVPSGSTFAFGDGTSTRIIQDGGVPGLSAVRFGFDAILGYEFPLTSKLTFTPQVAADYPLTSVNAGTTFKILTIQVLGGIRWRWHV